MGHPSIIPKGLDWKSTRIPTVKECLKCKYQNECGDGKWCKAPKKKKEK